MPPGKNQDRIKDYSSWRISHVDKEMIDGKLEDVSKSEPDIQGIRDDIMKTPLNRKEWPRAMRRGLPKIKK